MDINTGLAIIVNALGSVPILITTVINALKELNIVKDGQAETVSKYASTSIYLVLFVLPYLGITTNLELIDSLANDLNQLGVAVLALIPIGHKLAGYFHGGLRGLPIIGKSHS